MEYFTWVLTLHIMSFMSWMAMLFYLPRLFVYHSENATKREFIEIVKIQEFKLYKYIGLPAMWSTIFSGAFMLYVKVGIFQSGGWMYAKLFVVALLIAYSFSLEFYRRKLADDASYKSGKFFRFYNEVPTILSLFIVIFVIIKPF